MKPGRPKKDQSKAVIAITLPELLELESPSSYIPYRVTILGETRYVMASSASNAVKFMAYGLGAKATPISVREAVKAAQSNGKGEL
jgi:hypothetical protein